MFSQPLLGATSFIFLIDWFIYLLLVALGRHCCLWATLQLPCIGSSLQWLLLCGAQAIECSSFSTGLSSCGAQPLGAQRHVESSWTRDRTISLALAGGLLSSAPPGKSWVLLNLQPPHYPILYQNLGPKGPWPP